MLVIMILEYTLQITECFDDCERPNNRRTSGTVVTTQCGCSMRKFVRTRMTCEYYFPNV